jgi:toxin ParE1/3/4
MNEFVLRVSGLARSDIGSILEISEREFGPQARARYSGLIDAALEAIRTDPRRPGVLRRPEIGADVYTYYLTHARKPRAKGQVRRPRHLILFRLADPQWCSSAAFCTTPWTFHGTFHGVCLGMSIGNDVFRPENICRI